MNIDIFSAFIIGLLGAGHCLTMCGGITTMLTTAIHKDDNKIQISVQDQPKKTTPFFSLILSYNVGRLLSYSIIGALVAFTGNIATKTIGMPLVILQFFSAIFVILLGLYIGQWLFWLNTIERLGKKLWDKISPLSRYCLPINSVKKALLLGALWGWLPCGLVYSMLTWSLASGDALQGALLMAAFGLGTLPAMLSMAFSTVKLPLLLKNLWFKKLAATVLILYGIYSFTILL